MVDCVYVVWGGGGGEVVHVDVYGGESGDLKNECMR